MKKIPPQIEARTGSERAKMARFFCALENSQLPMRFWSKVRVNFTNGCWEWMGARDPAGYGRIQVDGRTAYAHRVAYEDAVSEIREGGYIDHACWNRPCVNPSHLQVVSNMLNAQNRAALNSNNTSGVRGVYWCNTFRRWKAVGRINKRRVYIGSYKAKSEAEAAVIKWRREHYPNSLMDLDAPNKERITLP